MIKVGYYFKLLKQCIIIEEQKHYTNIPLQELSETKKSTKLEIKVYSLENEKKCLS